MNCFVEVNFGIILQSNIPMRIFLSAVYLNMSFCLKQKKVIKLGKEIKMPELKTINLYDLMEEFKDK